MLFAVAFVGGILSAQSAWAQHEGSRWEDLFSEHPSEVRAHAGMTAYGEEPVRNQNAVFSLFEQDFSWSALVW